MNKRSESESFWDEVLTEYYRREEELTVRDFAALVGVTPGALQYRLYNPSKREQRERARQSAGDEMRLVAVDVPEEMRCVEQESERRWLEAETPQGLRLRFVEGTASGYVADLVN